MTALFLMSDSKFSEETIICNQLRGHLSNLGYRTLQLVSPGSQARYSITFSSIRGMRTIYPDLMCASDIEIVVGEVKPCQNAADKKKMMDLSASEDGSKIIRNIFERSFKSDFSDTPIKYCIIHGDRSADFDPEILQMIISPECIAFLPPIFGD